MLLGVSDDGLEVHPAGWPSSIAKIATCELIKRHGVDSMGRWLGSRWRERRAARVGSRFVDGPGEGASG